MDKERDIISLLKTKNELKDNVFFINLICLRLGTVYMYYKVITYYKITGWVII